MARALVIGAGFSGLVAAWRLQKAGFEVTVLEKEDHVGGLIGSKQHELGVVETAANGLLSSALVEELFSDIGLDIQVPKKTAKRRYLAVDGKVTRMPLTAIELFKVIGRFFGLKKAAPRAGEDLLSWANRALGVPAAQKLLAPAMLGIYASDAQNLSATLVTARIYQDKKNRSGKGRYTGTVSVRGGFGVLLQTLRLKLEERGVVFRTGQSAQSLRRDGDPIVIATSAWEAAKILKSIEPGDSRIRSLQQIESIPLVSMTLFFKEKPPRLGFGTLFAQAAPHGESDGILGCLQNSEIFEGRAKPGVHSEGWILGGHSQGEKMLGESDDELISRVLAKRDRLLDKNSREKLMGSMITRWPKAIPQYGTYLEDILPDLKESKNGILLFGNYLGQLGLASILESVRDLPEKVRAT